MTPTELRNTNFNRLRNSLADRMRDVYRAFQDFGPGSTAQIAERSGIGLLSLRPRATELYAIGLICAVDERVENGKKATIYAVSDHGAWLRWREKNFPADGQLQMGLHQGALTT